MHVHWPDHWRGIFNNPGRLQTGLGLALLGLVLAGLALAGWATVARSQAALPGDSLYGVKRLSEQVTLALTQDPAAKAQRHAQLLHTRLYEIVALVIAGRYENLPAAVDELRAEIDSTAVAARALAERYQNQGVEFVAQMEQMLNDASQLLASLAQAGPLEAQPIVGRAVVAAVAGSGVLRAQLPLAANMALNDDAPPATAAPLVATVIAAVPTDTPTPIATTTSTLPPSDSGTPTLTTSPTATATVRPTDRPPNPSATPVAPTNVPTTAPQATATANPGPSPAPGATATVAPVSTLPLPTLTVPAPPTLTASAVASTPTASTTPVPSATQLPTATQTPLPTAAPRLTNTPAPTSTHKPTHTPKKNATLPSSTPVPPPTDTPAPLGTLLTVVASLLAPWSGW